MLVRITPLVEVSSACLRGVCVQAYYGIAILATGLQLFLSVSRVREASTSWMHKSVQIVLQLILWYRIAMLRRGESPVARIAIQRDC